MVSILSMINDYLSYINLNIKIKNQVYTVMASVGDIYLLYVSCRYFLNGYPLRGFLFILAFLGVTYFAYLNILYYFTKKKSRFDISPLIEKALHIKAKDPLSETKDAKDTPSFVQTNGIFKNENLLPVELSISEKQEQNISEVVKKLQEINYLKLDYGGRSEEELFEGAKKGEILTALDKPIPLPYFELMEIDDKLKVLGGINQIERKDLATIDTIGLLSSKQANLKYNLYLVTVILLGGPRKVKGRAKTIVKEYPFKIDVRIAYRKRK